MKFSAALLLAALSHVLAIPANTTLSARDDLMACGTTSNAVASDCDKLLNLDFSIDYGRGHTCSFWWGFFKERAYNPVCLGKPGNCCIYTRHNTFSREEIRKYGKDLMQCRSVEKDRINGRIQTPLGPLCISDGRGCGDCFAD